MKSFYFTILLATINFSAFSQATDTCDYVAQENYIGGLDCAMVSLAPYTADSYQWLNCDSLFAPFPGDTIWGYTGGSGVNVALVVSYLNCIDTSDCHYVCSWSLEELNSHEIEIFRIVDTMGRETKDKPNTLLIYIYSDGTTEKVFRVE